MTVTLKNGKYSSVSKKFPASIFVDKQPEVQWLDMAAAIKHCQAGIGIWGWASNDANSEPDIIMVCAGDVPTLESLAAVKILREQLPQLKVRAIHVVKLMTLQPKEEHPSGLTDQDFDTLLTNHFLTRHSRNQENIIFWTFS